VHYLWASKDNWEDGDSRTACNLLPDEWKKNSVVVGSHLMGSKGNFTLEFNFCNFGPVHSWSYGTKENYDEIVKDYLKFESLKGPDEPKGIHGEECKTRHVSDSKYENPLVRGKF
jgi:hypothetical protein